MKNPCKIPAIALAAAVMMVGLCPASSVPTEWTVRIGPRSAAYQAERRHGDALALKASLVYNGQPLPYSGPARLYAQTNGMGTAWWDLAPCTVTSNVLQATWLPSFDTGADVVDLFLGGPSNYQAAARIRFLPSPGAVPNSLPLPVPVLDFAQVTVTNAPFATFEDIVSATNDVLQSALRADAQSLSQFAATGTVARYGTPTRWTDATGCVWEVQTTRVCTNANEEWTYTMDGQTYTREQMIEAAGGDEDYSLILVWQDRMFVNKDYENEEFEGWYVCDGSGTAPVGYDFPTGVIPSYASDPYLAQVTYYGEITATRGELVLVTNLITRVAYTNDIPAEIDPTVPEWAKEPSPPSYSAADVGAAPASIVPVLTTVSNAAETAKLNAETALRIVLGESVWFAVTNYMRTVEGVIPSLQLWEVRDSATNLVYDSREEITNTVRVLTSELRAELEARIPSKAWGNYQSDGTDNPEPGKVAIVNQPTVILTGGGTFNKYVEIGDSSIWVLTSSGPVSFGGGGANGNYFAVLDDEGNAHFKVSKTDSFDVEAIFTDNPRTSGDALLLYICSTNRQGEAYIGPPTLSACTNLQAAVWHDEADGEIDALGTSVAWARNDAIHAWVGTVTQDRWATAMFFRAKMKQEGGTAIINTAPVRFDGGIQLGNGTYRLVPYTSGGKTYLTVEGMP